MQFHDPSLSAYYSLTTKRMQSLFEHLFGDTQNMNKISSQCFYDYLTYWPSYTHFIDCISFGGRTVDVLA